MRTPKYVMSAHADLKAALIDAIQNREFGSAQKILDCIVCLSTITPAFDPTTLNDTEKTMVKEGQIIPAIKAVRTRTGVGLVEAKNLVVAYRDMGC